MTKILIQFVLCFSLTAGYYSDHPVVQELESSGDYNLERGAKKCPKRYSAKILTDRLGKDMCIKAMELPAAVRSEVDQMKIEELDNESDYDQRVTELLTFKWKSYMGAQVSMTELGELADALSISKDFLKGASFESTTVDAGTFSRFEGLFLGYDYMEETKTSSFIKEQFLGQQVLIIRMTKESELYPGGGFNVTHTLVLSKEQAMYVKLSWWNS